MISNRTVAAANIIKACKCFSLIIAVISVGFTVGGCNSDNGGNENSVRNTEIAAEVPLVSADEIFEDGTGEAYVTITRDDRSFAWVDNGGIFDKASCYYEEALLSDSVTNSDKINGFIHEKKDEFFKEDASDWCYEHLNYEKIPLSEPGYENESMCHNVSVRSVYLDDKYYSVNLEGNFCHGAGMHSRFMGYTFDISTGEEVGLNDVLEMSKKDTDDLIWNTINDSYDLSEYSFPDRESFFIDNYCINQDGKVYVFYDRNSIGAGYQGSVGYYIKKLDTDEKAIYQYMSDLRGGHMESLTVAEIDKLSADLHIPNTAELRINQSTPYCEQDNWIVPIEFTEYDQDMKREIPIAYADVNIETGEILSDTHKYRDL